MISALTAAVRCASAPMDTPRATRIQLMIIARLGKERSLYSHELRHTAEHA